MAAILVAMVPAIVAADSGGVLPWTKWALGIAAAAILILTLPTCISVNRVSSAYANCIAIGLLLFSLLATLQAFPLPQSLLQSIAPGSAKVYENVVTTIGMTPDAGMADLLDEKHPVSIASWLTHESTALMVVFAVFAFATSQLFVTRNRLAFILICIALTGAIQAGFGIYQIIADPTATVWGIKSFYGGVPFGSFVNRSNAAVMLNVGLASGLGLIAWRMAAISGASISGDKFPARELLDVMFDRTAMVAILCSLICVAGLLACGSRGGLSGTIAGLLLAFGLVQSLHRGKGLTATLIAVGLMATILLIKFELPAQSIERLQNTPDSVLVDDSLRDARLDHWKDGFRAAMAQPMLGWGLGTYRYAYLPYQQTSPSAWFINADNLWLEWFVETGFIGMAVLFVLLWFIVQSLGQLNASPDPIDHGLATAGWFALGSLGVSQFFDFGLRIPANSVITAVLASAVVARNAMIGSFANGLANRNQARLKSRAKSNPALAALVTFRNSPATSIGFGLVLGLMLFSSIKFLDGCARGDHLLRLARLLPRGAQFNHEVAKELRDSLASHFSFHPKDSYAIIELTHLTVDLALFDAVTAASQDANAAGWEANYQSLTPAVLRSIWYSPAATRRSDNIAASPHRATSTESPSLDSDSHTLLPFRANNSTPNDATSSPKSNAFPISIDEQRLSYGSALHEARTLAVHALLASPLSDEAHKAVVELDFAGGSPNQSESLIASLINLRRQNGQSLLIAGRLAAQAHFWNLASSAWSQTMVIDPNFTSTVLSSIPAASPVSLANILPNNVEVLSIAAQREISKSKPDTAVVDRAIELLERSRPTDQVEHSRQLRLLAQIYESRRQPKLAATTLAEAIKLNPGDPETRYRYVKLLRSLGNTSEARKQARDGRQIAPKDPRFEQLLTELSPSSEETTEQ